MSQISYLNGQPVFVEPELYPTDSKCGYGEYPCGSQDCSNCNYPERWEEDGPRSGRSEHVKVVTARKARVDENGNQILPGDRVRVVTGFYFQENGPRGNYFRREQKVEADYVEPTQESYEEASERWYSEYHDRVDEYGGWTLSGRTEYGFGGGYRRSSQYTARRADGRW